MLINYDNLSTSKVYLNKNYIHILKLSTRKKVAEQIQDSINTQITAP